MRLWWWARRLWWWWAAVVVVVVGAAVVVVGAAVVVVVGAAVVVVVGAAVVVVVGAAVVVGTVAPVAPLFPDGCTVPAAPTRMRSTLEMTVPSVDLNWTVLVPACRSDVGTGTAMVLAPQIPEQAAKGQA